MAEVISVHNGRANDSGQYNCITPHFNIPSDVILTNLIELGLCSSILSHDVNQQSIKQFLRSTLGVVSFPHYELLPPALLKGLEAPSNATMLPVKLPVTCSTVPKQIKF